MSERALAILPTWVWGTLDESPLGLVYLAATGEGICGIAYDEPSETGFVQGLTGDLDWDCAGRDQDHPLIAQARNELREYLAGTRRSFATLVDLRYLHSPFLRQALEACRAVPYGTLVSYGELARRAGRPGAARAAGAACKANTIAILVPCHRVVHAAGDLGGWTGPLWHKRVLLELEGVRFDEPGAERPAGARRRRAAPRGG